MGDKADTEAWKVLLFTNSHISTLLGTAPGYFPFNNVRFEYRAIYLANFATFLQQQNEQPSEHIKAWFDAYGVDFPLLTVLEAFDRKDTGNGKKKGRPEELFLSATAEHITNPDNKPWLVKDARDPDPEQPWYTPARYFARQWVIENSTLLNNRNQLATKVSHSLQSVGIKKRGGKKPLSPETIKKALINIDLG